MLIHGSIVALLMVLLISGCAQFPQPRARADTPLATGNTQPLVTTTQISNLNQDSQAANSAGQSTSASGFVAPGNDQMIKTKGALKTGNDVSDGDITLNFENTSLLEVVKVILGDLLAKSYVIDPTVKGSVTLQSSQPLSRDALLPTLELLLRMNGASLVQLGDTYRVVPRDKSVAGNLVPQLGGRRAPLPGGYSVQIVPLRFIAATEMKNILEPFAETGGIIRVDKERNLLIIAGSGAEINQLLDTIEVFDVDWLKGMSVAMFTPEFVDAKTLAEELEKLLGTDAKGPLAGLVRFITIDRLNGLLVVTPRQQYLQKISEWVDRLDQANAGVGKRLYVYQVKNSKAVELAEVLNQVFADQSSTAAPEAQLAPGLEPAEISSSVDAAADATGNANEPKTEGSTQNAETTRGPGSGVELSENSNVRIIADEPNNSLLILATADEFEQVQAALRQLDLPPLQVLIEVTIAEVRLEDQLSQGLQWFFKNNVGSKGGTATLDLDTSASLAAVIPGFSYAITDSASVVRAVLNTLATESKAKIISSPSLMVLNNQKASIQVGDQVPITTQQQQSTDANANIINSIEFRDTGVLLSVTPRVNPGGLVIMEVEQEVSNVAPSADASLTPTIQQRKINSTVAVQSAETVVLGGLIRENDTRSGSGIPGLRDVPVLGWFFGASRDELTRTELVVLITPRAVRGASQARQVTEEFRNKMDGLKDNPEPIRGFGPWNYKIDQLDKLLKSNKDKSSSLNNKHQYTFRMERSMTTGRPSRPGPGPARRRAPVALVIESTLTTG